MYVDEPISFFYLDLRLLLCVCLIYEFSLAHGRHDEVQYIECCESDQVIAIPITTDF